jgi:Ni,Fe-hydrogenase I small subunit
MIFAFVLLQRIGPPPSGDIHVLHIHVVACKGTEASFIESHQERAEQPTLDIYVVNICYLKGKKVP